MIKILEQKKNKHAQTHMYMVLAGIVIFLLIVFSMINLAKNMFKSYDSSKKSFNNFASELEKVATSSKKNSGETITLNLDEESAIIGMNPYSNFRYGTNERIVSSSKAILFKRPSQCTDSETCICLCEGFDTKDPSDAVKKSASPCFTKECLITCNDVVCKTTDKYIFKQKSYMPDVFDLLKSDNGFQKKHYWNKSILILRSKKISSLEKFDTNPTNTGAAANPLVVAGYRSMYPLAFLDVFVRNNGQNSAGKPVLDICFKSKCN